MFCGGGGAFPGHRLTFALKQIALSGRRNVSLSQCCWRYNRYIRVNMENEMDAISFFNSLTAKERQSLLAAVQLYNEEMEKSDAMTPVKTGQLRSLFLANMLPFIGFGIFDNLVMILAGEYVDVKIGTVLGLSTMAAAAMGNLISDVGGVGVGHYIEVLVSKIGLKLPMLSTRQMNSSSVRWTINSARVIGVALGCWIGMFPLLFFDNRNKTDTRKTDGDLKQTNA